MVPCITCDLPLQPVPFDSKWTHLSSLKLADPDFGHPGKIDVLLGVDVYAETLHGWRSGPSDSPAAFETRFGWVLSGSTSNMHVSSHHGVASFHSQLVASGDELLCKF